MSAGCPPLGRGVLDAAPRGNVVLPELAQLTLPERAVQFGTGALLRGLVDCFIDDANRQGAFNGRVVAIGSTGSGRDNVLNDQDGLYTLTVQGVADGEVRKSARVIASLSRAISARDEWDEVLACARNPLLQVVFSNTTEVGIALDEDDRFDAVPPRSFPGKLTRFLFERAEAFEYSSRKGVVVLPCELIERNGDKLRELVLELAQRWRLDERFARWIGQAVPFCNTLVDRIVTGTPADAPAKSCDAYGYADALLTECEPYRLFAIEGDDALRERLGFAGADPGIIVAPDITPYRERKVRILNGAHTAMVPLALLAGFETVGDAIGDARVGAFVRQLLFDEVVPGLDVPGAESFARDVLDRFANPFIRHALMDITLQSTMKTRVRMIPSIRRYAEQHGRAPAALSLGFAAFLLYMRGDLQQARRERGQSVPADDQGAAIHDTWHGVDASDAAALASLVERVIALPVWETDLHAIPGFTAEVAEHLTRLTRDGTAAALDAVLGAAR